MARLGESCVSVIVALLCLFVVSVDAKTIVVGGKERWTIPATKFKDIKARVGDVLRFEYDGVHTVVKTKGPGCDFKGKEDLAGVGESPFEFVLEKPGRMYFACDIPSHCPAGMRVAVRVRAGKRKPRRSGRKKSTDKSPAKKKKPSSKKKTSAARSSKEVSKTGKGGTAKIKLGGTAKSSAGGGGK